MLLVTHALPQQPFLFTIILNDGRAVTIRILLGLGMGNFLSDDSAVFIILCGERWWRGIMWMIAHIVMFGWSFRQLDYKTVLCPWRSHKLAFFGAEFIIPFSRSTPSFELVQLTGLWMFCQEIDLTDRRWLFLISFNNCRWWSIYALNYHFLGNKLILDVHCEPVSFLAFQSGT